MSEKINLYSDDDETSPNIKRRNAVEAALALIQADCLGHMGGASNYGSSLDANMSKLSEYADKIQEALLVEK